MVSFFSIFLHVEKYWWFQAFHYGFHSAPSNSSRNCSWSSPYWHFVYSKPQKMPKSNDISLFRIKLFKSFWGLRLFMSGCFGLPRRRLWLIIGSLSLSLLFWIGSYITPSKTTKDEVVLQYPSQRFTQNFGPPFCGEAQHDVRSKEEPLLSRGAERIWWPLWNSTWNRGTSNGVWKCLDNDIPICSYAKPRKHGSNKEHVVFTPTGITKRVKVVDIPCNVSSNWY